MKKILAMIPFLILAMVMPAFAETYPIPQVTPTMKDAFMKGQLVVKGRATANVNEPNVGKRQLMAERGAKVDAYRNIAEILEGVAVSGETTLKNMETESDIVKSMVQGMVKGAQVVSEQYDPLGGIATVYMAVPLRGENGVIGQLIPQVPVSMVAPAPVYAPPTPPPAPAVKYDGLIIDVTGKPFKPALINRILTRNGEIIYDPAKVAQNILVERGAAEYTNDVGKAKALLSERQVANPLVIKAEGLVKSTDAVVDPDAATNIFGSNQQSNYLEGAKVVFVLK